MSAHVPRINRRVLTVFLLVGLPILAAGVALVLALAQERLINSYGQHLEQVAQQTAAAVDAYVYRRILDTSLLARAPEIRAFATAASATPLDPAKVARIEAEWQKPGESSAAAAAVLTNPTARYLADLTTHDQIYREMLLTDRFGRLIAASNASTDYDQADEDWWKAAFQDGQRGSFSVTDVRWDESSQRYAIEIAVPVPEVGGERLAGILKVVCDSREMLALVGGVSLGATGDAVLLRDNASIVFSRNPVAPNARFFAADALTSRLEALRQGGPESSVSFRARSGQDEPRIIGVSGSQLSRTFPNLSWFVVISQAEDELLAPVRAVAWYLLTVLALTALAVLVFALWFSMRIAESPVAADMHLVEHAPVMHVGETDQPIMRVK